MASGPPPPFSFCGIAVDDVLAVPEIQELLTADAPTTMQEEPANAERAPGVSIPAEEMDIERQLPEDLRLQMTTRSIPGSTVAPAVADGGEPEAPPPKNVPQKLSRQHVHVMDASELEDLCRKLQVQTASIGHDKLEKAEARRQQTRIHELRAELSRLRGLETQLKQYQQRPMTSLASELKTRQQEIADLSTKLQAATQEERDLVDFMSPNLRK